MLWTEHAPYRAYQALLLLIVLASVAISAVTLGLTLRTYCRLVRSGRNGNLKRYRWMQVRQDGAILAANLLTFILSVWYAIPFEPAPATLRTGISAFLAVMAVFNYRDADKLKHPDRDGDNG